MTARVMECSHEDAGLYVFGNRARERIVFVYEKVAHYKIVIDFCQAAVVR